MSQWKDWWHRSPNQDFNTRPFFSSDNPVASLDLNHNTMTPWTLGSTDCCLLMCLLVYWCWDYTAIIWDSWNSDLIQMLGLNDSDM